MDLPLVSNLIFCQKEIDTIYIEEVNKVVDQEGDLSIYIKTSDGKTWSQIEFSGKQNLISVRKKNANTVVISTSNGELLEFN